MAGWVKAFLGADNRRSVMVKSAVRRFRTMRRPSTPTLAVALACSVATLLALAIFSIADLRSAAASPTASAYAVVVLAPPFRSAPHSAESPYTADSLRSLLSSLLAADYPSMPVELRIVLGPEADGDSAALRLRRQVADEATSAWKGGVSRTVVTSSAGLYELALEAWSPDKGSKQHAAIVDASLARYLPSDWHLRLTATQTRYAHLADVAAFSSEQIKVRQLTNSSESPTDWIPDASDAPGGIYLYANAAYVPLCSPASGDMWRAFQRWFHAHRSEWFLWPGVTRPNGRRDPQWPEYHPRALAHWSVWYTRFLAENNLFVAYSRGSPTADDKRLPDDTELLRVTFNGTVLEQPKSDASLNEVNEIAKMARQGDGSVALTVITEPFLETARSWICNVQMGGFKPKSVVWITPDEKSYEALRGIKGTLAVRMHSFKGGRTNTGTHFGTPGYWLLMLERTKLIRDLVGRGVAVFAFETDQIWLRDPMPTLRRIANSGDVDLIGTLDTDAQIAGNFLYVAPTLASRRLWREIYRRFLNAYMKAGMHLKHTAAFEKGIMNDQSILTHLTLYDKSFNGYNGIVFRSLDKNRYVDGRWYVPGQYGPAARSPTMINNNFVKGIQAKVERAKRVGHWFWDGKECNAHAVDKAIGINDARAPKAIRAGKRLSQADVDGEADYDIGFGKSMHAIAKVLEAVDT